MIAYFSYIRVSTLDQNEDRQRELIQNTSYPIQKEFLDKTSGKNTLRPSLLLLLDYVREGDIIITESYSRISRSLKDLLKIIEILDFKKVSLISLKENIDTSTAHGRMVLNLMGTISQYELDLLKERQSEGIAIAKAKGKYKGRQSIVRTPEINQKIDYFLTSSRIKNYKLKQLMADTGLKRSICCNFIKLRRNEIQQNINSSFLTEHKDHHTMNSI